MESERKEERKRVKTYTKLRLFLLGQRSRGRVIALAVLHAHRHGIETATQRAQQQKAETDRVALLVVRLVRLQESIRGNDTSDVTEADLPGRTNGATMVPAEVHVEPTHDDGHCRVCTHRDEEERGVLHLVVIVDREQDGEAGHGDADWEKGECEAVTREIRGEGDDHGKPKGTRPRRHAVELGLDG